MGNQIFFSRKGCFKSWKPGKVDENKHQLCDNCISTFILLNFTEISVNCSCWLWESPVVFMFAALRVLCHL